MFNPRDYLPLLSYSVIGRVAGLLVFMTVFAAAISVAYSYYLHKTRNETQDVAREMMLEDRQRTLVATVEALSGFLGLLLQGTASPVEQEKSLRAAVNAIRYGQNGYFFIYDQTGRNIAHPFFPEFQGQPRIGTTDDRGRAYIRELTEKALQGGGFVTYNFYKPGELDRRTKMVYARLIPGSKYWLATGTYIDDIKREQRMFSGIFTKIHRRAITTVGVAVAAVLVFFVLPVSLLMISSILKPWRELERELMQAQKMEAVGIFAGGIAHDFGNVLGSISSCTELALMDVPQDAPVREDLLHISKAVKRGKNLVRRIKKFSSKADTTRQSVNMARITEECLDLVQTITPANISVVREIHAKNISVMAHPDQLLQIIMNLCTNAEQAMRGMRGQLSVSLDAVELDAVEARTMGLKVGSYARLSVRDTGAGMKPVMLKRIFEPFYTSKKKSGGTGLGLSMTQSIVNMYGGAITVASTPGKGSSFHVLLPCSLQNEDSSIMDGHLTLPRGHENLLLVDDDKDLLVSLHKLFSRLGYNVTSRTDGTEALDIFFSDPDYFDLVFTDQLMPGVTGTELIRNIKALRPRIPVILCSGFDGEGILQRVPQDLDKSGIAAFFRKPFDSVEICRGVRQILDATHHSHTEKS